MVAYFILNVCANHFWLRGWKVVKIGQQKLKILQKIKVAECGPVFGSSCTSTYRQTFSTVYSFLSPNADTKFQGALSTRRVGKIVDLSRI